jgi:hypothetical protein
MVQYWGHSTEVCTSIKTNLVGIRTQVRLRSDLLMMCRPKVTQELRPDLKLRHTLEHDRQTWDLEITCSQISISLKKMLLNNYTNGE